MAKIIWPSDRGGPATVIDWGAPAVNYIELPDAAFGAASEGAMNTCCEGSAPSIAGLTYGAWRCPKHGLAPLDWVRQIDWKEAHLAHWRWGPMGFNTIDHAICGAALGTVVLCDFYLAFYRPCQECRNRRDVELSNSKEGTP
jgi:hypothetical protein